MPAVQHRQKKPGQGIEYSEISIPDDKDMGTGTYTAAVMSAALANPNPIIARLVKTPEFQLSLNINSAISKIPVLLGRADTDTPTSRVVFELNHEKLKPGVNVFRVQFKGWLIQKLLLNDEPLPLDKGPGGYSN